MSLHPHIITEVWTSGCECSIKYDYQDGAMLNSGEEAENAVDVAFASDYKKDTAIKEDK